MKETVPQKPLEPVLHEFLLSDHTFVPASKIEVLKLSELISTQ